MYILQWEKNLDICVTCQIESKQVTIIQIGIKCQFSASAANQAMKLPQLQFSYLQLQYVTTHEVWV